MALFSSQRDKAFTCVTLVQPLRPEQSAAKATARLVDVRWTNGGPGTVIPQSAAKILDLLLERLEPEGA